MEESLHFDCTGLGGACSTVLPAVLPADENKKSRRRLNADDAVSDDAMNGCPSCYYEIEHMSAVPSEGASDAKDDSGSTTYPTHTPPLSLRPASPKRRRVYR